MKRLLIFLGLCLLFTACSSESEETAFADQALAPVTVCVNGFSMSQEDFSGTRTDPVAVASYSNVKVITLAFYDGTDEVYKATQTRENMPEGATFGNFSLNLPMGSYTMVVLGYALYDDDVLTLTSPTQAEYTAGCVRETFGATQTVNITTTSAVSLSATLNRQVARLWVVSTDARTSNASKVRMTFSAGGKAFNPTTGYATDNSGVVATVNISAAVGATSGSVAHVFLTSDEQNINVTIDVLNGEGTSISQRIITGVPFKRNRVTKLTGSLYTASSSSSFLLDTDWLTQENIDF